MTGYGEAQRQVEGLAVVVEVRSINSRYFKLTIRVPEGYTSLEPKIEPLVREKIKRGAVIVGVRINREPAAGDYRINPTVLSSYRSQLEAVDRCSSSRPIDLSTLLLLPGVVEDTQHQGIDANDDWSLIRELLGEALSKLTGMRGNEGQVMSDDLLANGRTITNSLDRIEPRVPVIVKNYQNRLTERLNTLLAEYEVSVEPADVVREIGIFTERSDVSEEIVRLRSHLKQFDTVMNSDKGSGRTLEFLAQEMFREANTIGSKANDAEVAQEVIEIKAAIERIREMIQNVE